MLTFRQFPSNTVDGSEIRPTTWDGVKTLIIMGFQLPTVTSTGERSISEPSTVVHAVWLGVILSDPCTARPITLFEFKGHTWNSVISYKDSYNTPTIFGVK